MKALIAEKVGLAVLKTVKLSIGRSFPIGMHENEIPEEVKVLCKISKSGKEESEDEKYSGNWSK